MIAKREPAFRAGDWVRILHTNGQRGRIVELRGPLGPGGIHVYRLRVRRKPNPVYNELCEDQLELIPTDELPKKRSTPGDRRGSIDETPQNG